MSPRMIEGIVENGLIRPLGDVTLRDGEHVHVTVPEEDAASILDRLAAEQGIVGPINFDSPHFNLPIDDEFLREIRELRRGELAG